MNVYARGAVTAGTVSQVGGLVGGLAAGTLASSYSSGLVTGGSGSHIGGLLGQGGGGNVSSSYWDNQSSGLSSGNGNGASTGITGQTTAQLQSGTLPSGFSSSEWLAPSGAYPYFGWQGAFVTISGTAYNGASLLSSAGVSALSAGSLVGTTTTNGSGFYSFSGPANTMPSGGVLTYLTSGGTANAFSDGTNGYTNMDLHTGTLSLINGSSGTLSALNALLSSTLGGNSGSNFLFTVPSGQLSLTSGTNLSLISSVPTFTVDQSPTGAGNILINTTGGLTIASGQTLTAGSGSNITLAIGGAFTNSAANALSVSGGGRWLVYSQDPADDSPGNLTEDFKQYNATYGVTTPAQSTGNALLYALAPTISVALTGTATKTYDGTTSATLSLSNNISSTGAIDGDNVAVTAPTEGTYSDANVNTGIGVTVSGIALGSATNGSIPVYGYQLASASASGNIGTITPASLTYTANSASQTYGSTNPTFTGTVTGFVNGETLMSATAGTATFTSPALPTSGVGNYAINGSGLTAENYTFVQAAGNASALTITPATLTYAANAASQTYGSNNPMFTGAVTGFVNGETLLSATAGTATFTSPALPTSGVGNYAINGSGLTAENYTFVQAAGNASALTITPATLTYAANAASQTYGSNNPMFTGAVTGFVNGETLLSATAGTATFTSPALPTSNVGNYAINGSGLTAENYTFVQAAGNASALTINPATLTYAANAASQTFGSNKPMFTGAVTGFVNGETLLSATAGTAAFTSSALPTSDVGNYAINGSGLTAENYTFVQAAGNASALTINPAQLTYFANPTSRPTGISNPRFNGSVFGFVNDETLATAVTGVLVFAQLSQRLQPRRNLRHQRVRADSRPW